MTRIETRLRVMSWNLWWQFGPWEERLPAIAATLAAVDADVSPCRRCGTTATRNQAAELADGLGYEHVYASRLDLDGVQMGNAVLSRWPITSHDSLPLPGARPMPTSCARSCGPTSTVPVARCRSSRPT